MTPKQKAQELIHKYVSLTDGWVYGIDGWNYKKKCALIAVDEILSTLNHQDLWIRHESNIDEFINFWEEVKQEIEKL